MERVEQMRLGGLVHVAFELLEERNFLAAKEALFLLVASILMCLAFATNCIHKVLVKAVDFLNNVLLNLLQVLDILRCLDSIAFGFLYLVFEFCSQKLNRLGILSQLLHQVINKLSDGAVLSTVMAKPRL